MSEADAMASLAALLESPASTPPPGVIPNLENPPNERTVTYVVTSVSLGLVTLSVLMCIYSRLFITRKFGLSEYAILLGFVWNFAQLYASTSLTILEGAFIAFCAMCFIAGQIVPGVHMWNVRLTELGEFLYYLRLGSILYAPTIFMIKLSILWQYIQVFMPNKRPKLLYWTTVALIAANAGAYLILLGLEIWSCRPMRKSWDPLVTDGTCLNISALNIGAACVNVVSDTAILLLPQAVIWRLHMPFRQKAAVSAIFLIAMLAITSAAIRLYYSVKLMEVTNDVTWYSWMIGIWSLVEITFGFVVACMPSAGAFFRSFSQSKWFLNLKGLTTWRRIHGQESTMGYAMENCSNPRNQQKSWEESYVVSGRNNLDTMEDSESAQNLRTE